MALNKNYDYIFKILIVGDSSSGKSSLLLRLSDNEFNEEFNSTIGVDFANKIYDIEDKVVKLQVWDSSGQCRFRTITTIYYRNSNGILIVFDISDRNSFKNIKSWVDECKKHAPKGARMILIGNKSDLYDKRRVSYEEAKEYADNLGIDYIETSAKNDINVDDAFMRIAKEVKRNYRRVEDEKTIKLTGGEKRSCFVCNNCY